MIRAGVVAGMLAVLSANAGVMESTRHCDEEGVVRAVAIRVDGRDGIASEKTLAALRESVFKADAEAPWACKFVVLDGVDAKTASAIRDYASDERFDWRKAEVEVVDASALEARIGELLSERPRIAPLDGVWLFRRGKIVSRDGAENEADTGWESVEVPHDWAIRGPFLPDASGRTGKLPWRGTGRYRRRFTVSAKEAAACAQGGKVYLEFDGVMARPEVFVNGRLAGGWDYGYMSFTVDATRFVKSGENELEVTCDTRPHKSRWYPGGGIFRSVRMKVMPRDHVVPNTMAIVARDVSKTNATVEIRYVSSLRGPQERTFAVSNPRLWDVDDPYLYEVTVLGERFRYGIRTIRWTADDGFHLNGRRVQLQGVNLHADMGPLGMAFDRAVMRRQLRIMKEMGANAIRTSHNAPDPQLLDLCDEMGLLVWDECFDKWDGTASRREDENLEDYIGRNLAQFVRRDRNHPSVIVWSMSNEIPPANSKTPDGLTRGRCARFREIMLAEDGTRPIGNGNVGHHCNPRLREEPIHADLDLTGWNYEASYRALHEKYPHMPLVYSESASAVSSFGAYENPPANGKNDWPVAEGEISAYDHNCGPDIPDVEFLRMETDRYCAGEFVWTGIDYLGEPFPYTENNIGEKRGIPVSRLARSSYYGICDLNGFPKDRYWLYRSLWRPDALTIHILPHWNWAGREGRNVPVYVYTNGDEAELFLNGRSLGRRRKGETQKADPAKKDFRGNPYYEVCDRYRLRWLEVPYEPGELKVVVYRSGVRLGERIMRTADRPVAVRVTPEGLSLPADGAPVFCEVDLVDGMGTRDPLSKDPISVSVEGPGEILAVSNGDAREFRSFRCAEGYPLFYGKACVVVRRRRDERGPIVLTVRCGDLEPGRVSFDDLASRRVEVTLSPDGSVSTPEAAIEKVRKLRAEGLVPIGRAVEISVMPGRYRLGRPLSLGPADANIRFVGTDPNTCVFDGGTRLLPFTIGADGVWETDAPEGFSCDQLWVNGKRAIRARSPNAGHFFVRDVDPFNPNRDFFVGPHELAPLARLSPDALHRVRAWVWQSWDTGAIALEAVDAASGRVSGRNRLKWPLCRFASTGCPRYVLENFRAALDAPGEWFHDWERGKILYLPRTGEKVGATTATVPRANGLIDLVGTVSVAFENIGFEHAGWEIGSRGVENLQSAWLTTNAAVLVVRSTNVVFRNVRVAHAGAHGVWFADGTRDASLIHSQIEDVGACGVRIGSSVTATRGVDGMVLASGIEVTDSIVRAGGREQEGSAGILLTHVADCRVVHNDIYDFYYTGVSVGWTWGYAATLNRRNRIDSNRIHHVNQGHLSDMAAVYTLGDNEGTTVCGNWIHDVVGYPYSDADSCGFYTDEGSHGILFASNLVERCPGVAVNHHYGRDVTFANNIFSGFRTCGVSRVREEGHPTIRVVNNVFLWDDSSVPAYRMGSAPAKIGDLMADGNVYWCTSGLKGKPFYGSDWLGWQALGKDSGSVIADPLFKNASSGDWRLKEGSPSRTCGFVPFDWTRAGVDRRDSRWAAIADETTWAEPESVVKPPSYASLPMACDFNRFPIGKYVTDASCQILKPISGVPGSFWVVTDREAGRRVLKIVDQSAEKQSWCPHLSTKGCYRDCKLSIAFSICLGKGAQVECAFRDDSCGGGRPYATGGEFAIGGNVVPEGRWTDVRLDLDLKERRWNVRSKPRRGEASEGTSREIGDVGFRNLTWFGFMSTGAAGSEWRLTGLRIKREDR